MKGIRGVVSFVRTVAAGSFAAASKDLKITPVAVSGNVQRLERQLGVRLLQRSTRKLSLTEEGRLYYERCIGPLRDLELAEFRHNRKEQISYRYTQGDLYSAIRTNIRIASASRVQPSLSSHRNRTQSRRCRE